MQGLERTPTILATRTLSASASICLATVTIACGGDGRSDAGIHGDPIAFASGSATEGAEGAEGANGDDAEAGASGPGGNDGADSGGDQGEGDGDAGEPEAGGEPKWDTLSLPDAADACAFASEPEFSYLWAANSVEGTISKIDTKTVTEVGRYLVRPDANGSPSRTSVSLSGDVAVANRSGGITKIHARESACLDTNGIEGIQTSKDSTFLPWALEECRAWHRPMTYHSQRPVAWGPGVFDPHECAWKDEELWTSGANQDGKVDIYVLDGDDGAIKDVLAVPVGGGGLANDFFGLYGGAVDGDGNFWGSQLGTDGRLIRVRRSDMTYDIWDTPDGSHWYGMTVDSDGMVWLCSAAVGRFDPVTETWTTAMVGGWTGCMADAGENGLLWMSNGSGVIGVDRDTLTVTKTWDAEGSYGVSIDFEGYVWAVENGTTASKIDPVTGQYWTYTGLIGAYTYSDMTGYALSNVGKPSG